jgi:hypothetical protein
VQQRRAERFSGNFWGILALILFAILFGIALLTIGVYRSYTSLPSMITSASAINILNDIAVVNGILLGFGSIITARNFEAIDKSKESISGIKGNPDDSFIDKLVLYARRLSFVILDVIIILCALYATFESLFGIARIGASDVHRNFFLLQFDFTYVVVVLILLRMFLALAV